MDSPPSPKGFRKRWRAAAAELNSDGAASNEGSEESCGGEASRVDNDVVQPEISETVAKRTCIAVSDNAVSSAFTALRKSSVKMPWETGPLSPLFTGQFVLQQKTELPNIPLVGIQDVSSQLVSSKSEHDNIPKPYVSLTNFAKKRIAASKFTVNDDDLRVRALGHFRNLICSDLKGTRVGSSLLDKLGKMCGEHELATIVSDTLAHKSTGTLLKRASSMARFFSWMVHHKDTSCFRPSEKDLYEYMQHLRHTGAGPTAASHFEQAFRMCHEVLGMLHVDIKQVLSPRVTGAAHTMFLGKRKLVQAPAFSLHAIQIFEDVCLNSEHMHKRVIAGALMFCVFSCARWFDAMHIDDIWKNVFSSMVLLEADCSKHKTSISKEAKTRLLPFVCLGRFLEAKSWGVSFMEARDHFGLSKPFLPSWNESTQTFGKHRMTTCEATCWIHELLEDGMSAKDALKFSSHSCKATLLTWAGMTTLFTREERTLLGHHVEAQTRSSTTYNRDSQVMLQYKVTKLIAMIKTGRLKPDASRAERLAMMVGETSQDERESGAPEDSIEYASSDDDSEDISSPCAEFDVPELAGPDDTDRGDFSLVTGADQWLVHAFTGVAHFQVDEELDKVACGRKITSNLRVVAYSDLLESDAVLCKQCESAHMRFAQAQLDDDQGLQDILSDSGLR